MNGAAALVRMLIDYGVEVIFGVPGDTNVALYEALRTLEGAPKHVLCRDERSAVFMADCYARVTGKPGIAEVPSGAGALYGLPGVAEANKSSVPLVLLVNDIRQSGVGRGTLTELPVEQLFQPIAKHAETLAHVAKLPEIVRRAFRGATAGCPGAVVLALPEDLLLQEIPELGISFHTEPQCRQAPAYRSRPPDADLDAALIAIFTSKRPLVIAGGGVNRSGAGSALTKFAERLGIPVVTTITGQGVIGDDHELGIGTIGDNGFHPHAIWALQRADLTIYVGCRMGSVATMRWQLPRPGGTIVQIDLQPAVIGNNYVIQHPLMGDARAVLDALLIKVPDAQQKVAKDWVSDINERRAEFWEKAACLLRSESVPLRPERVIGILNRHLPMRCHVISDAGTPTPYATRFLRLRDRSSKLIMPRFYGGLGYAIPAVVGAWFAAPHTKPVGLFGDGSLGMSAGELETLARLQVPAVLIHFSNACFGSIKALQRVSGRSSDRAESSNTTFKDPTFSVDFGCYDMSKLAAVFGIHAFRVETPQELEFALHEAFRLDEPVFVDAVVESIADRLPPVFSLLESAGFDPTAVDKDAVL